MKLFLAVTNCFLLLILQNDLQAQWKKTEKKEKNDTEYIQNLINEANAGDTVKLPERIYYAQTIHLKSGVSLYTKGLIKQLPPDTTEDCTLSKQFSKYPLFYGKDVHRLSLTFNAHSYGEAIHLSKSADVAIEDAKIIGDSTKLHSFAGIYLYRCNAIEIERVEVANYGKKRQSSSIYQRGTGIRAQSSRQVAVRNSEIHHNGENGIFFHSCADIDVHHNDIHHNGMSGIQVAFGSVGIENNYKITYNNLHTNAADAIDINNPDFTRMVDLEALIEGNESSDNGWVSEDKTRDGSGIATLVGLKNVLVKHNKSIRSNRPSIYLRECDMIEVRDNEADNFAEIVGKQGQVLLYKNKFAGLRLLSDLKAKKLTLDSNNISDLAIPNGIMVDSLVFLANDLKGNVNVNMAGKLIFKNNVLLSSSPRGAIALWKVNGAVVTGNQISMTGNNDALYIHNSAADVLIEANKINSLKVCIKDAGSHQLKIIKNTLATSNSDSLALALISTNPNNLHLQGNSYYLGKEKSEKAIGLEGEGKVYMKGESYKLSSPDGDD